MTTPEKKSSPHYINIVLILVTCVLVFGITFFVATRIFDNQSSERLSTVIQQQDDFDGSTVIDPPRPMPDFTLTSQKGTPLSLIQLQGKPTLLFFGYTHCPDICPLTLNEFKQIQSNLDALGEAVNFLFISVDGSRDTPENLNDYFELRGVSDFFGMTGDEDEVRRIGADYALFFERTTQAESATDYLVDHTSSSFLLDAKGRWVRQYVFGIDPNIITEDIRQLLES